jgi:hypothetical protein
MKKFNVKMYVDTLLHSEFNVFAHDEAEAKKEADKLEEKQSNPAGSVRVMVPRFQHAVTEIPDGAANVDNSVPEESETDASDDKKE